MLTSTAARIELLVCFANARSFICAHCVQSVDLQVCCPTSFTGLPNDLSPEGPAACPNTKYMECPQRVDARIGHGGGGAKQLDYLVHSFIHSLID